MLFYNIDYDPKFPDVKYASGTNWEGITCPKYDGHQRAGQRIGTLRININKKTGDFLWTFLNEVLITNRIANLFIEHKITGFELKEVEVINKIPPFQLWEMKVIGNGGEAHESSGIKLIEKCEYCGAEKYSSYTNGLIVNVNNWDGSDIFTIVGYTRHILVSEKLKLLLEKNKVTGIKIIPSHELKWPEGVMKK